MQFFKKRKKWIKFKMTLQMASILVLFIILTDNFEKIWLILVLKVAFKL